jgi:ABC-type transport system substrate-binding protein
VTSSGAQPSAARIAVRARLRELERISPLSYRGGFHTKALAYETLVRIGEDAQLAPGLAESWEIEDEGRTIRFRLRVGAKWHDGKPVLAKDVAVYFRRWLHLPEHSWLRACERILAAEANGAHELVLRLSEPRRGAARTRRDESLRCACAGSTRSRRELCASRRQRSMAHRRDRRRALRLPARQ